MKEGEEYQTTIGVQGNQNQEAKSNEVLYDNIKKQKYIYMATFSWNTHSVGHYFVVRTLLLWVDLSGKAEHMALKVSDIQLQ